MSERRYFEQFVGDTLPEKVKAIRVFDTSPAERMFDAPYAKDSRYIGEIGEISGSILPVGSGLAIYHLVKFINSELGQAWFKPEFLEAVE